MKRRPVLAGALAGALAGWAHGAAAGAAVPDNRTLMRGFADRFYRRRDVRGAFGRFVAPDYVQHNPDLPDGRDAAVAALAPMFAAPGAAFEVKHLLVDGDLALVHLFGRGNPATRGAAVADVYRLHGGRVVEHWDVIQPIAPGTDPLDMARQGLARAPDHTGNRAVIAGYVDLLYRRKQVAAAFQTYVAPDLVQHNTQLGKGRAAAIVALTPMFQKASASFDIRHMLVDGDLAALHYHGRVDANHSGAAVVEVFRLAGGRIVEHWDVFQPMPGTAKNPHPMF